MLARVRGAAVQPRGTAEHELHDRGQPGVIDVCAGLRRLVGQALRVVDVSQLAFDDRLHDGEVRRALALLVGGLHGQRRPGRVACPGIQADRSVGHAQVAQAGPGAFLLPGREEGGQRLLEPLQAQRHVGVFAVQQVGGRADAFLIAGVARQRQRGAGVALALARAAHLVVRVGLGPQRAALPDAVAQCPEDVHRFGRVAQRGFVVEGTELRFTQPEQRHRLQPAMARLARRGERGLCGLGCGQIAVEPRLHGRHAAQRQRFERRTVGVAGQMQHRLRVDLRAGMVGQRAAARRTLFEQFDAQRDVKTCRRQGIGGHRNGLLVLAGPRQFGQPLRCVRRRRPARRGEAFAPRTLHGGRLRHGGAFSAVRGRAVMQAARGQSTGAPGDNCPG